MADSPQPETVLSMSAEKFENCRLIKAQGRVDFSTAPQFLEALKKEAAAVGEGGGLVVDLSGLDLITSAGLRALMLIKQQLAGSHGRLVVSGVAGTVAEVIRIARFDTLLTLTPTMREGLHILSPEAAASFRG